MNPEAAETDLNIFLRTHRVLTVRKELVNTQSESPSWAIAVEYLEGVPSRAGKTPSIDYREVLNEADFEVFRRLRDLRKELAEAEGKPVYTIFTNAQLAEMVQRKVDSLTGLKDIEGVGDAKVEKYGERFLEVMKEIPAEKSKQPAE